MYWNDIEEIVKALEELYQEEEIPDDNLLELKDMVLSLSDFEGHDIEVDEEQLNKILETWIELRNN